MSYAPNQPAAFLPPKSTVNFIRNNFATFATAFAVNHGPMATGTTPSAIQGKHKAVILKMQPQPLGVQDGFASVFGRVATQVSGDAPNVFWKTELKASKKPVNDAIQYTYNKVNLVGANQQSFLPGGFIVYTGLGPAVGGPGIEQGSYVITLPAGAETSRILSANVITNNSTSGIGTDTATIVPDLATQTLTVYYFASIITQFQYVIIGRV